MKRSRFLRSHHFKPVNSWTSKEPVRKFKQKVQNSANAEKTRLISSETAERIVTCVQMSLNYSFQHVFGLKARVMLAEGVLDYTVVRGLVILNDL